MLDHHKNIHCIGDRANNVVLDIFDGIIQGANMTDRRPRIEHAQIMSISDLARVGRLGGEGTSDIFVVTL